MQQRSKQQGVWGFTKVKTGRVPGRISTSTNGKKTQATHCSHFDSYKHIDPPKHTHALSNSHADRQADRQTDDLLDPPDCLPASVLMPLSLLGVTG